jgi:hypothetical protein
LRAAPAARAPPERSAAIQALWHKQPLLAEVRFEASSYQHPSQAKLLPPAARREGVEASHLEGVEELKALPPERAMETV